MAGKHGARVYYQVLLSPNRATLVDELAKEAGVKSTEMIRRMVYAGLERDLPASIYKQADAADQAVWRQSVRNRVEGRARSKKEASQTDEESATVKGHCSYLLGTLRPLHSCRGLNKIHCCCLRHDVFGNLLH